MQIGNVAQLHCRVRHSICHVACRLRIPYLRVIWILPPSHAKYNGGGSAKTVWTFCCIPESIANKCPSSIFCPTASVPNSGGGPRSSTCIPLEATVNYCQRA